MVFRQATVADHEQMGALLIGVEKVTHIIAQCRIYEAL